MNETESLIHSFIIEFVVESAKHFGGSDKPIGNDDNLMANGYIDSLGFVSLMSAIELKFEVELDFDGSDPEKFMTVSGLAASTLKAMGRTTQVES
jgi:acyl carrier protein